MDYTKYHFSAEADLMRQASLDPRYVSMHLSLHGEFAMQVSAMWSARASMSHPADLFLSFLTGWLCSHVLGVDQAMARQLDLVVAKPRSTPMSSSWLARRTRQRRQ